MDDVQFGTVCRAVRIQRRKTQSDIARAARVHRWEVSLLERGEFEHLSVAKVRRIAVALSGTCEIRLKWRGPMLERVLNAAHAALHGAVLRYFEALPGWETVPEVTYSIFGERGAIDILAWHAATRTLLVIELKTTLVDAEELVRKTDERMRLAARIGAERGWEAASVASWVILTDTRTNRRHVAAHRELLAPISRIDGRRMRAWLRSPDGPVAALSFWAEPAAVNHRRIGRPRSRHQQDG